MTRIGKMIGFFLLIVFALQVTDLTCTGEDLSSNNPGIQGSYQLEKADTGKGKNANSPTVSLDECQCPCHLSFTQTPSAEVNSYQSIGLSFEVRWKK